MSITLKFILPATSLVAMSVVALAAPRDPLPDLVARVTMLPSGDPVSGAPLKTPSLATTPSHEDAFRIMNDAAATIEARHAAEDLLLTPKPVHLIPMVFAALDQPVPTPDGFHFSPSAIGMFPGGPNRDVEAQILPVGAQIVYARVRIWESLVRNAQPVEKRAEILGDLFPLADSEMKLFMLLDACTWNWSERIETRVLDALLDDSNSCRVRATASQVLRIHTMGKHLESALAAAWALRGDDCAITIAGSIINPGTGSPPYYDPRFAVLLIDQFDRAQRASNPAAALSAGRRLADYLRFTVVPPADARLSVRSDTWRDHVIETTKTWLNEHRERLEADAAKAAAGEKPERPPAQPGWRPYDHDHAERIMRENIERAKNP